jgi:hypothetical protein
MFVRFRKQRDRLQASLVETQRVAGKIVAIHLGGLGSVDVGLTVTERLAFWDKLPKRLDRIGDRIGSDECDKICALLHARIPIVTSEEQASICGGDGDASVHTEGHLEATEAEPTEADVRVAKEALADDPIFASLSEEQRKVLFKGILEAKLVAQLYDDVAPQYHFTKLAKSALELQKAIKVLVRQIERSDTHLVQALGEMRRRGFESDPLHMVSDVVAPFLFRLLECSGAVSSSGQMRPPPIRPPKALAVVRMMVKMLESVGVQVGATGGDEGGPATRLMVKMNAVIIGKDIGYGGIKDRLKRLKDWEARHRDQRTSPVVGG